MKSLFPENPILPDAQGFYGNYGGSFVPEILYPNIDELTKAFDSVVRTPEFWKEYTAELKEFSGRPTPITRLKNLSRYLGGAQIVLKREDLGQTGAHKINNVIGQTLLAKSLGKTRLIAETGAGQHGVATATAAARYGLDCEIYMGAVDVRRQRPNVFWMENMGAKVNSVTLGNQTLKDAINEAMRDWASHVDSTHYLLGTTCGPHPFPALVSYFQSIIGLEARVQMEESFGRMPNVVMASVGGGSNAMGIFQGFLGQDDCKIIGVEAGGRNAKLCNHARRFGVEGAKPGIAQGYKTIFLQNEDGQMQDTHSVAAGLDYVGVSPIIAHLHETKAISMGFALDTEVVEAVKTLAKYEGIIGALESSHAVAAAIKLAPTLPKDEIILVNLSGRGDKDIFTVAEALGDKNWGRYLMDRGKELTDS